MSLALAIISMNIILNTISAEGCVVWMPISNMRVLHEEMMYCGSAYVLHCQKPSVLWWHQ
jgi:hypothetical protein